MFFKLQIVPFPQDTLVVSTFVFDIIISWTNQAVHIVSQANRIFPPPPSLTRLCTRKSAAGLRDYCSYHSTISYHRYDIAAAVYFRYPSGRTSDIPVVSMYMYVIYTFAIGSVLRLPYVLTNFYYRCDSVLNLFIITSTILYLSL